MVNWEEEREQVHSAVLQKYKPIRENVHAYIPSRSRIGPIFVQERAEVRVAKAGYIATRTKRDVANAFLSDEEQSGHRYQAALAN